MTTFRIWCDDCGADGTIRDRHLGVELVEMHAENHPDHAPDIQRVSGDE